MTVALLAISDGRHAYHEQALRSALEHLPRFDQYVFIDDARHELGFAGAIQAGWDHIRTDWVFHLELDFTLSTWVDVDSMIALLALEDLAQVSLKRQPWNAEEIAAGGIIELHPDDFTQHDSPFGPWTAHRRYVTTNPSVYSARLCRLGWPQVPHSEGIFTHQLLADPATRFAIWGAKHDPPTVHHIGADRAGGGY